MTRRFAPVAPYAGEGIDVPQRKTADSAGYDIAAAATVVLPPQRVTLIPTGLKAYMQPGEVLLIHIRSGFATRNAVSLANGVGVIDADYADNADNEGHIQVAVYNHSSEPVTVTRGERVAQGLFIRFLTTDDDCPGGVRTGGLGSTG